MHACTPQVIERKRGRKGEGERGLSARFLRESGKGGTRGIGGQGGCNGRFAVLACQGVVSLAGNDGDRVGPTVYVRLVLLALYMYLHLDTLLAHTHTYTDA